MAIAVAAALVLATIAAGQAAAPQEPSPWPATFHAKMRQNRSGAIAQVDLYYDWPGGRNLHVIVGEGKAPFYDNERQNGTTYYYTPSLRQCKSIDMGVGLLPPDWLRNATFKGQATVDSLSGPRLCNVFEKGDAMPPATGPFVVYYEDVALKRPARWIFFDGAVFDIQEWIAGGGPKDKAEWQLPDFCFSSDAAASRGAGAARAPPEDLWRLPGAPSLGRSVVVV